MSEKLKKRWSLLSKRNKYLILIGLIIFILLLSFAIAKTVLYINFILGNDILIKLSANQENFELENEQETKLDITSYVDANPFCKVQCSSALIDISSGEIIERDSFQLNPVSPIKKEFLLKVDAKGTGQKLYRFDLECSGIKTFVCNTKGELIQRNLLITLEHNLNQEQLLKKTQTKQQIIKAQQLIIDSASLIHSLQDEPVTLANQTEALILILENMQSKWDAQDYSSIDLLDLSSKVNALESTYNQFIFKIQEEKIKETIQEELKLILEYDILCEITNTCTSYLSIQELETKQNFNITETCNLLGILNQNYQGLNQNIIPIYQSQNYPSTFEFNQTILILLANKKQTLINSYLDELSEERNTEIIKEILIERDLQSITLPDYNLTPALIFELTKNNIVCGEHPYNDLIITPANISLPVFNEPVPVCCYKNNCTQCCVNDECRNDPEKYPIIFLHGHDFNKDLSASYSLNSFNLIEKELEKEGYLTAGIVSLSTPLDDEPGIWGMSNIPITLRGSYYFDVFKYSNSTEILETKSENIDTYSIRLNDLVEIVKYKTAKPKVIIVAHSMGGLVARRYVQVFGNESVEKLILIGAPNQGIEGSISTYCSLFGEKIECRDMNKNSLFMNKLNSKPINVNTSIIIGTGCKTDNEPSDGIVLERNAKLNGTAEFIINGTCEGVKMLHNTMLNINQHPEVYSVLKQILSR